ncbi:Abi family protein [Wolinella succinogenes]|uniref:Abi family protein n=1 Tax=Wolinella succinogenes TaxID=844 RepID=UPI00240914B8|nr:Abi family protein [Wolinella succinogenes]
MKSSLYSKPYKSPADLIIKLKSQNLTFIDEQKAQALLSSINYFRFKIYLRPFLDATTKIYKPHSSFEDAYCLYCFDTELKNVLFALISDKQKINSIRVALRNEFLRSKDDFALHYKDKYINEVSNDFKEMPPFWIISELSTFGNILAICESIDKKPFVLPHNQNVLDNLAREFGAKNLKELNSWLKLIRDVRNRVAHHSRVWNCNYREPLGIRQRLNPSEQPSQPNKIYLFFIVLEILHTNAVIKTPLKPMLKELFNTHPVVNGFLDSMGIPSGWIV